VIPSDWEPHHRLDDGELIGYLIPDVDGLVVPTTIFGYRLGEAMDRFSAEQTLDDIGLSYLADVWLLMHDDGTEQRVVLVECNPEEILVANADFALVVGAPRDIGERQVLPVPTERLRRP
jgi:hypothetical protein